MNKEIIRAQIYLLNPYNLQSQNKLKSEPHISNKQQSSQNPVSGYGQPVVQSTHLVNQSPYMNPLNLQNATAQAEKSSTSRTDPSVVELFNQ